MSVVTEGSHATEALISEANGSRSRENVQVASGQNLKACAVIGFKGNGTASAVAKGGNAGNGAMGAITVDTGAKAGAYKLTIIEPGTDAGKFIVEDPDGVNVGSGTVGSAFTGGGLAFTLADGNQDFASGDQFTITVALGTGEAVELDLDSTVGAEVAAGVMIGAVDASSAATDGAAWVRDCELDSAKLVWPSGFTSPQKAAAIAQLATRGIICR